MNTLKNTLLVFVLAVFAVSCEIPTEPKKSECKISVSTENIELEAGNSTKISVSTSECSGDVRWESNNPNIASVEKISQDSAKINVISEGQTSVKASIKNKSNNVEIEATFNPVVTFHLPNNGNQQAIYVANENGIKRKITDSSANMFPQWISNGERIAYLSKSDHTIYSVDIKGENKEKLTSDFYIINWFSVSPEEKYVSLSAKLESDGPAEIYVQNIETKKVDRITFKNIKNGHVPNISSWSPDGEKIAFSAPEENKDVTYISNPDGSDKKSLTSNYEYSNGGPRWSPFDKDKILITSKKGGRSGHHIMNPEGEIQKHVTSKFGCENWKSENELICHGRSSTGSDIFSVKLNGSNEILFESEGDEGSPDWRKTSNE